MKKDFIPVRKSDIVGWEERFRERLANLNPALGIDPAQAAAVIQQIDDHRAAFTAADQAKSTAKSKVAEAKRLQGTALGSIRKIVRQIKASPTYNGSVGRSMGIIGPENSKEITRPQLKTISMGGRAVISYKKYGSHGIYLYSRRGNETQLTLLAADTRSPYVDTRPNLNPQEPEKRHYAAYYMINDAPVGEMGGTAYLLVSAEGG